MYIYIYIPIIYYKIKLQIEQFAINIYHLWACDGGRESIYKLYDHLKIK